MSPLVHSCSCGGSVEMKIYEITRPAEIRDAAKILLRAGYRDIAYETGYTQGTFSTVMYRPGDPFLIKLFVQEDYSYRRFLKLIKSVRNQHFPVIRGQPIRVSNNYYAVRLEHLQPFPQSGELGSLRYHMQGYLENLALSNIETADYYSNYIPPSIRDALDLIYHNCLENYPGSIVDLHRYNVMLRGNVVVIIDPTSYDEPSRGTPKMGTLQKFPQFKSGQQVPPMGEPLSA